MPKRQEWAFLPTCYVLDVLAFHATIPRKQGGGRRVLGMWRIWRIRTAAGIFIGLNLWQNRDIHKCINKAVTKRSSISEADTMNNNDFIHDDDDRYFHEAVRSILRDKHD